METRKRQCRVVGSVNALDDGVCCGALKLDWLFTTVLHIFTLLSILDIIKQLYKCKVSAMPKWIRLSVGFLLLYSALFITACEGVTNVFGQ
jgi:hypothetical protein